jgi:uncharacterized protein YecE (DUF72 family)
VRVAAPGRGRALIGISGYDYKPWRGGFYPPDLPARDWLRYASRAFDTIEINGTFYSLKSPAVFERWRAEAPDDGFVFAIKGGRFITHNLKLRNCETALGNFFAQGVLALGRATGPFLWQLPDSYRFDPDRIDQFLGILPRDSTEGEAMAREHDHRLRRGVLLESPERVPYRHALEVRHPTYFTSELYDLVRAHGCALVASDGAERWPMALEVTAGFAYVRLHGSSVLYTSRYSDEELDVWAARVKDWQRRGDVYVYFDNDAKVHAPHDARRLIEHVRGLPGAVPRRRRRDARPARA